ncbi:MAG: sigma-54-dependent Fis family transcriptional regulator [Planctomycetes bacterium]|nr:sigma-54-dependent Fis family transcriptional regulator [Planctomycetota bacterium]
MTSRILVVDDERMVRWSLRQALERVGYQVDEASTAAEALEHSGREAPDVVLLDHRLPDKTGLEVLRVLLKATPRLPVVMITAHASIDGAVEAMKEGAFHYLSKPFEVEDVLQTVQRALEMGRLREEVARRREEGLRSFGVQNIVAESPAMAAVVKMVRRVAQSEASTILLLGESGVGKGLVAHALHYESGAVEKPFVDITCTALTETLLESELFGHEKGAFTDARTQKKGLFELADSGTVFLDEIGDLTAAIQGKLLRFLEEKSFRRVGGTRDIRVNLRVIAATNKDLAQEVEAGRFRRDLYFRLNVIPIHIPPLRERREDILPLARGFVRHYNAEFRKQITGLSKPAEERLVSYSWPGNVRELRNAIERAMLLAEARELALDDLPLELRDQHASRTPPQSGADSFTLPPEGLSFEQLEKHLLIQALDRCRGNRTRAARLLGMNRDRIRYRIQKFGLEERFAESG